MHLFFAFLLAGLFLGFQPTKASAQLSIESLTAGEGEKSCVVDDANGDGNADLMVANEQSGQLHIWYGTGELPGGSATDKIEVDALPTSIAAGDLDGDGFLDLAAANHEQAYLTLLFGAQGDAGSANFQSAQRVFIETVPHSHQLGIADFDGDGRGDLLVDSRDAHGLYMLRNLGDRSFDAPGMPIEAGGAPYRGFALGDFNNDGLIDIAVPNTAGAGLLENDSGSDIQFAQLKEIPHARPFSVVWADFNADEYLDLFIASEQGEAGIGVYPGDGSGNFPRGQIYPVSDGATQLASGDINHDGYTDVVAAGWNSDLRIILGGSDGTRAVTPDLAGLRSPWGICVGDLNADGRDEFIVADGELAQINIYSWVD